MKETQRRAGGAEVDFGFERVRPAEKRERVKEVFDTVAERYDLMNDLMSFGLHRAWKRLAVALGRIRPGQRVLDLAAGTGDMASLLSERTGPRGQVVVADINPRMLARARARLVDRGRVAGVSYAIGDAESLPFAEGQFHCVCIAFGLRNVTRKERALESIYRVLRPGGQALILEFSRLVVPALAPLYDAYSFKAIPELGRLVTGSAEPYRYLAESIRMHPDQSALQEMMEKAGFERCRFHNLSAGVVALHRGCKL